MWTTNFCKSLFKNVLLYINSRLSKIRSVHTYVMTRTVYFDCSCTMYIKIFLKKTLIEVCSPHLYSSFRTFCAKTGQTLASQWVFKHSEEFQNRRIFLQRLTLPRIIDKFWRKMCQKKHIRVFPKICCCIGRLKNLHYQYSYDLLHGRKSRGLPKNMVLYQYFHILPDFWKYLFALAFFKK